MQAIIKNMCHFFQHEAPKMVKGKSGLLITVRDITVRAQDSSEETIISMWKLAATSPVKTGSLVRVKDGTVRFNTNHDRNVLSIERAENVEVILIYLT